MSHTHPPRRGPRALSALCIGLTMLAPPLSEAVRAQPPAPSDIAYGDQSSPPAMPQFASGAEARALLDSRRNEALRALQAQSRRRIDLVVDRASLSIILMDLDLPTGAGSPAEFEAAALKFLNTYQALLDPLVDPANYVLSEADQGCQSVTTVVLELRVDDRTVLGSKVTVDFSAQGSIVAVSNAVASAPPEIQPAADDPGAYERLKEIVPSEMLEEVLEKGHKVLVPESQDGRAYLRQATLLLWREEPPDGPPVNRSVLVGVEGGLGEVFTSVSPAGMEHFVKVAGPSYHTDPQTGLTDSISYHDVGGVKVATLPLDRNPFETAYRFLEDHPSLFHTGAARCQYRPRAVLESKLLPGVQFVRMEQRYVGLPVSGAELVFEIHDKSTVMSVSGHVLPDIDVNPWPQLGPSGAVSAARQAAPTPWPSTVSGSTAARARRRSRRRRAPPSSWSFPAPSCRGGR